MRLVYEAGVAAAITVSRFDMASPDKRHDVPLETCLAGTSVDPPGSLFVARHDGKFFAAFGSVPPHGRLTGFGDLATPIVLAAPGENTRNIMRLIAILRFWRRAHPHGVLAALRKTNVMVLNSPIAPNAPDDATIRALTQTGGARLVCVDDLLIRRNLPEAIRNISASIT